MEPNNKRSKPKGQTPRTKRPQKKGSHTPPKAKALALLSRTSQRVTNLDPKDEQKKMLALDANARSAPGDERVVSSASTPGARRP